MEKRQHPDKASSDPMPGTERRSPALATKEVSKRPFWADVSGNRSSIPGLRGGAPRQRFIRKVPGQ